MTERSDRPISVVVRLKPELVVFAVVAVVVFVLIAVPFPVDPMKYLGAGLDPGSAEPTHWSTRIGLVLPVWLVSRVFGYSEVTFYTVAIVGTAGLGAATVMAGRLLFDRWVGVGAAVVVVVSPFVLPYASQVLPDIGSAALITFAFAWIARAVSDSDSSSNRVWVAGVLMGCAYLVRETSLLFLPGLLAFALILRFRRRAVITMLAASLGVAVTEAVLGLILWSDPLARLHALQNRASASPTPRQFALTQIALERQDDFASSTSILPEILWASVHGRVMLGLLLVLVLGIVVYRSRRLLAMLAWVIIPWLLFAGLGTMHPDPDRVLIRLALGRYWAALLPPMVIGGLGALSLASRRGANGTARVSIRVAAVLVVLIGGMGGLAASIGPWSDTYVRLGNDQYWQLRDSLAELPADVTTIEVNGDTNALLNLYKNDPIGRPVFAGDMVSSESTQSEWAVIDLDRYASPRVDVPSDFDTSALIAHTFADGLEWAILTSSEDQTTMGVIQYQVGPEWQARLVIADTWGDPEPLTESLGELGADEELVVYDRTAGFRAPSPKQTSLVNPGEVVFGVFQVEMTEGRVRVICDFFEQNETSVRVQVAASIAATTVGQTEALVSFCAAPTGGTGYLVRPVLVAEGPGKAEFGMGVLMSPRSGASNTARG